MFTNSLGGLRIISIAIAFTIPSPCDVTQTYCHVKNVYILFN